jgi:folate-dependent tRNA-U54 methylase TrmFO/GidA
VLIGSLAQFTTEQKHGVLQPTPLNGNLVPRFESRVREEHSLMSLAWKKVGVLGV